jgi:hypothetical protein
MRRYKNNPKKYHSLLFLAVLAFYPSVSLAEKMSYGALIGNHEFVTLEIDDHQVDVGMLYMNGRVDKYSIDLKSKMVRVSREDGSQTTIATTDSGYVPAVLKMRDLVAHIASPTSLDATYPATKVLRPELNALIEKLNTFTALDQDELANCVLFADADERNPWLLSAGVHGFLGKFEDNISRVWVRLGYELVLMSGKGFIEDEPVVITAKGDGLTTGAGLPVLESMPLPSGRSGDDTSRSLTYVGAHYTLAQTDLYHHVGSVVCRPDLSNTSD